MGGCTVHSYLLLFLLSLIPLLFLSSSQQQQTTPFKDVNLGNPIVHFVPMPRAGYLCERVHITGVSRLSLGSYANSRRVTLKVSEALPERLHGKIEVCFLRNVSIGLCQCEIDEWQTLQKGQWSTVISPYENRYVDVNFKDKTSTSCTISIEEEFQQWRLAFLGFGFLLLLSAPIISNWVPFYYSSSMALGILLVVLIILFQGMKLLPMGRKNILYLTIYGSVLGVGSYIAHYFSTVVNSILVNFGLSEEMHNPVSVFLLVGIILAGAALGYWIVRKFVLSEDGNVDADIAQFVKWAMRIISVVFVFLSTLDAPLALVVLVISWSICSLITSIRWRRASTIFSCRRQTRLVKGSLWHQGARQTFAGNRHAEFLSRSAKNNRTVLANSSPYSWSSLPSKGHVYSSPYKRMPQQYEDYYSTYHRMPTRKFSKKEWEDFTRESTREALTDWASTPEVAKWVADNAQHMQLNPDSISDDTMESSSGSSEETALENGSMLDLFRWG
ncbi:uncharacterized protein LOC103718839 isoform X3 [Phoenix dactylifera]|uniref:Uncharacterized protein LOC103718839 isoform X3 n=1 Tax=Phoenix dactylifera TaxID=42345 RepID=A0A8B8JAX5_PHODC|nr:uncharacterized protein LOC103718839 isoform X3 [Phoenix dactylifera]